ncbi:hypothetical protein DF185_16245 [Marinifilum breve]|uniref:Uncharacterized protein n=1 Tax=Marinifilum breve TaxID=2184082 RepID=A0A2V3ZU86_9BACT|nr:hypothetical protein [Marinifilum breve]PXX98923.1 hypothetical protein DF185_16245 [Marinifilum breve]
MTILKKRHDFIAGPENIYVDKAAVYKKKLPLYKDILGLTDEEIAADIAIMDDVIAKKEAKDIAVANASAKIEELNESRGVLTPYMRNRRVELMAKPNYTKAIGVDLGIEITYTNQDTADMKPEVKVKMQGGYPTIKISKQGTDGVRIYSRINGEGHFKYLDTCNGTQYIDVREKKDEQSYELREYTFFYIVKDTKVGKESNVYKLSF